MDKSEDEEYKSNRTKYMKTYFLHICFLTLFYASTFGAKLESSDSELSTNLVGTWTLSPSDPSAKKLSGEISYKSDSSLEGVIFIKHGDETTRWDFAGNWKIEKSRLITTLTKSSVPDITPVGNVNSVQIEHITDKELVTVLDNGKREVRIKK